MSVLCGLRFSELSHRDDTKISLSFVAFLLHLPPAADWQLSQRCGHSASASRLHLTPSTAASIEAVTCGEGVWMRLDGGSLGAVSV
jgi:hypothetical protein